MRNRRILADAKVAQRMGRDLTRAGRNEDEEQRGDRKHERIGITSGRFADVARRLLLRIFQTLQSTGSPRQRKEYENVDWSLTRSLRYFSAFGLSPSR